MMPNYKKENHGNFVDFPSTHVEMSSDGNALTNPKVFLEIVGPDGQPRETTALAGTRVSIGRVAPDNRPDIPLDPDPDQLVSRLQCFIERDNGHWWVIDNDSPNGTFVRRGDGAPQRVLGRRQLAPSDVVCVLGGLRLGQPVYWELRLNDPFGTRKAHWDDSPGHCCIEYDWVQDTVSRWDDDGRVELTITGYGKKLLKYMADRNRDKNGVAVLCTHSELIEAVWEKGHREDSYHEQRLRDLVSDVRAKIEPSKSPRLLTSERGGGYRLISCALPDVRSGVDDLS